MNSNQILQADLLDLVFDNRNKMYGAYELRRTYDKRVKKSMLITGLVFGLAIAGTAIASSHKSSEGKMNVREVTLTTTDDPLKKVEPPKPPEKQPEVKIRTEIFVAPKIEPDDKVIDPPPTQDQLDHARIDNIKVDGVDDTGESVPKDPGEGTGIIDSKPQSQEEVIFTEVQVPAHFNGNWVRYLESHINPNTPVDNGAPVGQYTVLIRFVVDKEGHISDLTPLTKLGYGMEDEAMRVLRDGKSSWEPGIQNGVKVKSYHQQPITFIVADENGN